MHLGSPWPPHRGTHSAHVHGSGWHSSLQGSVSQSARAPRRLTSPGSCQRLRPTVVPISTHLAALQPADGARTSVAKRLANSAAGLALVVLAQQRSLIAEVSCAGRVRRGVHTASFALVATNAGAQAGAVVRAVVGPARWPCTRRVVSRARRAASRRTGTTEQGQRAPFAQTFWPTRPQSTQTSLASHVVHS